MRSVASRLRTAVRSCHSSGKTYTLAQILLWWLVRWPDGIAVTTAPTDRQVEKLLWGEIHKAIARCPYPLFTLIVSGLWERPDAETGRRPEKTLRTGS